MARNNWFEFKQFRVEQQKAAMKVGTDGVLLGAWATVGNAKKILDVGTGTGLIALMLAQRCDVPIDAVEIDNMAFEESRFNFEQSKWNHRLTIFNADFSVYARSADPIYGLIVSNPPYFIDSLKTGRAALTVARHNDMLTFGQLISGAHQLLCTDGRLCVIIPFSSFPEFRETARVSGFYLYRKTVVLPKTGRSPKRVLLEFGKQPGYPVEDEVVILDLDGSYTPGYKLLTSPYYPAF